MLLFAALAASLLAAAPTSESPILLLLPNPGSEEVKVWSQVAESVNWHFVAAAPAAMGDAAVKALETQVDGLRKERTGPVYLIGAGPNAALAFYAGVRAPHLFTAVLSVGGSPKPAIETDRLFAANA